MGSGARGRWGKGGLGGLEGGVRVCRVSNSCVNPRGEIQNIINYS